MDIINIVLAVILLLTFVANLSGAKKSLKSTVTTSKEKPQSWLQKVPVTLATIILVATILGIFSIGTYPYLDEYFTIRIIGLLLYIFFSWFQIWSYRSLGNNYSQDILIYKNHKLITGGPYKYIRHPHYLSQILIDLGAGLALLSYLVIPLLLIEIPILIMRALLEDKLLKKHFGEEYSAYKNKSGLIIPFIG
jgi:protein-S-isoprenylcysteine O-methyltransferase Ste14